MGLNIYLARQWELLNEYNIVQIADAWILTVWRDKVLMEQGTKCWIANSQILNSWQICLALLSIRWTASCSFSEARAEIDPLTKWISLLHKPSAQ